MYDIPSNTDISKAHKISIISFQSSSVILGVLSPSVAKYIYLKLEKSKINLKNRKHKPAGHYEKSKKLIHLVIVQPKFLLIIIFL